MLDAQDAYIAAEANVGLGTESGVADRQAKLNDAKSDIEAAFRAIRRVSERNPASKAFLGRYIKDYEAGRKGR